MPLLDPFYMAILWHSTYCICATKHLHSRFLYVLSSVDAYQESCLGTVVNMSTLRIFLDSYKGEMNVYHFWEEWARCSSQLKLPIGKVESLIMYMAYMSYKKYIVCILNT